MDAPDLEPFGQLAVEPADPVQVATAATWRLVYTCGPEPIGLRGMVVFCIPRCGWSSPLPHPEQEPGDPTCDAALPGMVWAECSEPGVALEIGTSAGQRTPRAGGDGVLWLPPGSVAAVRILDGELRPGQSITLTYGDTMSGSPGAISGARSGVQRFQAFVDPRGDRRGPLGGFHAAGPHVEITCLPGPAVATRLTLPSSAAQGEPIAAVLRYRDRCGNPIVPEQGTVALAGKSWNVVARSSVQLQAADRGLVRGAIRVRGTGVQRVSVQSEGLPAAVSNPVQVTADGSGLRLFWGDLHAHTGLSDGVGTPAEAYQFAREMACLDFCALTDHDTMLDEASWEQTRRAAAEHSDPLRFITFLGYEYTGRRNGGDRAVYYPADTGPLLRSQDSQHDGPLELFAALGELEALVVPVHPARPRAQANWRFHDPRLQRLVEVYSCCGNCEYLGNPRPLTWGTQRSFPPVDEAATVQAALAAGHRLGLICGSDSHCGRPGHDNWIGAFGKRRGYSAGLTAVSARELTREALWDALQHRRCYGTTGARIIVEFTIAGEMMGSELRRPAGAELALRVRVAGTEELAAVEVVTAGGVLCSVRPGAQDGELAETIHTPLTGTDYYYVRVLQVDGEMAWAGPIWVEAER